MTTILSIQSSVAYGHVGNSAATFLLMRLGVEVFPVLTVHYSNTTAYGTWRGPVLSVDDIRDVVTGIDERGALAEVDAVLTGYQGSAAIGEAVLDTVALVRERNPKALYCCDPVMGDVGRGFFVAPGIPEMYRDRIVPQADIITPNQFELEFLTGKPAETLDLLLEAADTLRTQGPGIVVVTSAVTSDLPSDEVSMLAVTGEGAWVVSTPKLPPTFTGSGDITSAAFLASYLELRSVPEALARTAGIVYAVLEVTAESGHRELRLVKAQDALVNPPRTFEARRIR
ncbi:MAG TPA: pyridoxal kinase PdxY [Propionibacteriaceae bacterium]|nr:pyridoxal kinase PdxY [Propionibacteriaceae bacterium]